MKDELEAEAILKKIEQLASYSLYLEKSTDSLIFNKLITTKLKLVKLELEKIILDALLAHLTKLSTSIDDISTFKEAQIKTEQLILKFNKLF